MNRVYRKGTYNIYQFDEGYVVHNTALEFADGHSHINNFKTAKYLIDLCIHRSIPHHLCIYLLQSLVRISDDDKYKEKIESLISVKKQKDKIYYYNRGNKKKRNYPRRTS